VIGGGPRIRELQNQVKTDYDKDMIARAALWEHAQQLGEVAAEQGWSYVPIVPRSTGEATRLMQTQREFALALSWLQAGQSTDATAILAADIWRERFRDALVVILSNVAAIYTADPKVDRQARPIRAASVDLLVAQGILQNSVEQFKPGMRATIDPVAVNHLQRMGSQAPSVFFGQAQDINGVRQFLLHHQVQSGTYLDPHIPEIKYYGGT
jgi:uridylate kinase